MTTGDLLTRVALAIRDAPECEWGVSLRSLDGTPVLEHSSDKVLSTASVGKVLLLVEVARRFELDPGLRSKLLSRTDAPAVADSGLWQHLHTSSLPMVDAAILVASVSDNWATNVILNEVGLAEVRALQKSLGLEHTSLLDSVRDRRSEADIARLSAGTANELSGLMARLCRGDVVSPSVALTVASWLSLNVDLSMVASAFDLDPLAPTTGSPRVLFSKTGTDRGVRADTGVVEGPHATLAYAVIANWTPADEQAVGSALAAMRAIGAAVRRHVVAG